MRVLDLSSGMTAVADMAVVWRTVCNNVRQNVLLVGNGILESESVVANGWIIQSIANI